MNYLKDHAFKVFALSIVAIIGIAVTFISPVSMLFAAPPGNPPKANVSPTFSGLTVTGTANLEGDVTTGAGLTATYQPTATSPKASFIVQGLGLIDAHILDLSTVGIVQKTAGDMIIYDDLTVGPNYRESGHWASPLTTLYGVTKHLTGPILLGNVGLDNNTILGEVLYIGDFNAWNVSADRRNDGDVVIQGDLTVGYSGTGKIYADQVGSFYTKKVHSTTGIADVSCDIGSFLTGCTGYGGSGYKGTIKFQNMHRCRAFTSTSNVDAYATCFDPTGVKSTDSGY